MVSSVGRDRVYVLQSSLCLLCGGDSVGRSECREARREVTAVVQAGDGSMAQWWQDREK